jgi:hypothetical protein
LLSVGALIAALALLWAGFRKLSWKSPAAAILSVLDIFALALAIFQLGWLGLGLFVVLNALGFIGWGLAGAIYVQAELSGAKAFNATDPERTEHVDKILRRRDELKVLGPRRRARLVHLLAERHRDTREIEQIAPPIGLLWTLADKPDLEWLVERFDTVLRAWNTPAADAMRTADTITSGALHSAASVAEMLEALAVAGGGSPRAIPKPQRSATPA